MPRILCIESSTRNCSVALFDGPNLLAEKSVAEDKFAHAEKLHAFAGETMHQARLGFSQLDAVAVGAGPGSYTGLRIGVAAAKGFCFPFRLPLISVSSLQNLAISMKEAQPNASFYIPLIDARRMEAFAAVYDTNLHPVKETWAEIFDENSFADFLENGMVALGGDGAQKIREVRSHSSLHILDEVQFPSAINMGAVAMEKFKASQFEDLAYYEPDYGKEFIAEKPKRGL